ncbi:hypothetical protein M8J75_001816 [Diaphorina citri]|nr:hypothetical protein M8J75_001816 [Diaphorina citri]
MSKGNKLGDKPTKDEDLRMWSAIVFVIILFVIGVPLWWHLTTVERVDLPTSRIERLNRTLTLVHTNISVITGDEELSRRLVHELTQSLQDSTILKYHIEAGTLPKDLALSPKVLEATPGIHPQRPGVYQLVLCPELESKRVLFGAHRTLYFSKNVDIPTLSRAISANLLQEPLLLQAQSAITPPDVTLRNRTQPPQDPETLRRVRLSSRFDLILTAIVPDPDRIRVDWDFGVAANGYIQPLLDQLSLMSNYSIKSQWLYHVDLEQTPTKTKENVHLISHKQMSHIVSSLENKLECDHVPMFFTDGDLASPAIISDRWGSIQIVNPDATANCKAGEEFRPEAHPVMSVFLNDLKQLLGVKNAKTMSDIDVVPYNAALLTDWEIDALFRIRTVEQITSSKLTLSSLIQLLDQISNIVITSQVGDAVLSAVQHAEHTQSALDLSDLGSALTLSREAFNQSEAAFTHPSLLALLYFPDDQKYAVYIPLFLPVMIPVILSLHAIIDWVKKKLPENVLQHIQLPCIPDQTQLYDNADEKED